MIEILKVIFSPSYWLMNYNYSKVWDEKLNELLEKNNFTDIGEYDATIWEYKVWISNHPYASFRCNNVRPSRRTIMKARVKLEESIFNK